MGRRKYELYWLSVTTSFPSGCLWKRASQIALAVGLEEQAVPRMEAWSSFQRCHLNPHVWDLPYVWFNSCRILSPASSPGVLLCLQHSPRCKGEGDFQTLEATLWKFHPPFSTALVVSGTLELCHNHSSWKHLSLSLQSGAELHFHLHKHFASVLPTAIPGCHEAFRVCPSCWCLQSLLSLGTAAMTEFDPNSSPSLPRLFTREAVMPELCSETWPGITRCTREPLCLVSMTVLLFIGNLFASSLSHHGLNTSLVCSAEAFPYGDGVCAVSLCPLRVCPRGFSWLKWNRDEVWLRFSCPGEHLWGELTGSTNGDVFAPWSQSCFQEPCPLWQPTDVAVHARLQLGHGESWKAAGPSCAVSKAANEPGSTLPSPDSCKYSCRWIVQAASVCLVLRNHKAFQSSVPSPGWISPAAMPIILGQG